MITFDRHLESVARKASQKVTLLRRMKHLLNTTNLMTLYKAQVRPIMEYAPLTWMASAQCHLNLLDRVQRRAMRLINEQAQLQPQHQGVDQCPIDTLEHRRRVGALTVLHKAQVQRVSHLVELRVPWRRVERNTRTVLSSNLLLEIPRSNTSRHQRTFTSKTAAEWNLFTADVDVQQLTTHQAKLAAHAWCRTHPP